MRIIILQKQINDFLIPFGEKECSLLSSDILTQFRDRGDEIRVYPLSFAEFYNEYEEDKRGAWQGYYTYGGMPLAISLESHEEKSRYLKDLFDRTYIQDVLERHERHLHICSLDDPPEMVYRSTQQRSRRFIRIK